MEVVVAVEGATEAEEGAPTVVGLRPQEKTEATLPHGTGWSDLLLLLFSLTRGNSRFFHFWAAALEGPMTSDSTYGNFVSPFSHAAK